MYAIRKFFNPTRLVYAITLLGAALRFYQLGYFSLWDGEIFTLFISQKELPLLLSALRDFGAHPPMWFLVTRAFDAFGWNEWMLRAPAAFVGILAIPAMYVAGKRAAGTTVGLIAALLFACAPLAVLYAQLGRMYSIIYPLTALILYAMTRALQSKQWRWWFALSAFSALIVYNQYLSLLAVGSAYLMAGLILLWQAWRSVRPFRAGEFARAFFRFTARMWASFGAFLILLAPLLPLMSKNFFQRQLGREATTIFDPVTVNADFLRALFLDLAGNPWLLALGGFFIVAGIVLSLRKRDVRSLLLAVTWFGLVFAVVTIIHPRRFPSRYVLHLLPVYILLIAHGIVLTGEWLSSFVARANVKDFARAFTGICAAVLVMLSLNELGNMYRGTQEISRGEKSTALLLNGGWRELARYLDEHVAPGDVLVYGGDGPVRPPRFIAPYVSAAYQTRAHTARSANDTPANIWWVGVNLDKQEILNPTNAEIARQQFGETSVARIARPITWEPLALPQALSEWERQGDTTGIVLTQTPDADGASILRAEFSAPVNARLLGAPVAVQPGQLFRMTARVRGVSEGFYDFSPALRMQFLNAQNKTLSHTAAQTLLPADADGWQTLVLDGVVPAQAAYARPALEFSDYSFAYAPVIEIKNLQWQIEQPSSASR